MQTNYLKHLVIASMFVTGLTSSAQVIRGYTGTQVFSNCGNPDPAEPICGVLAGAELWVTFVTEEAGALYLNTEGSTFDTLMGVFIRSPGNPSVLQLVGCDNNSGVDGLDSALSLPVQAGQTNFVIIAGVNGACGTLQFNYSLVTPSRLTPLARTPSGQFQGRVTGHAGMRFTIQVSSNLTSWDPLLTATSTNATFDFVDTTSPIPSRRSYRALMLP